VMRRYITCDLMCARCSRQLAVVFVGVCGLHPNVFLSVSLFMLKCRTSATDYSWCNVGANNAILQLLTIDCWKCCCCCCCSERALIKVTLSG